MWYLYVFLCILLGIVVLSIYAIITLPKTIEELEYEDAEQVKWLESLRDKSNDETQM